MALTTILPSALNATQTFSMANLVVAGNITAGNISGAASGLTSIPAANITGSLSSVTDISASGNVTLSGGTANGVAYLNGSKVLTTGSALTFDGTRLTSTTGKFGGGAASNSASLMVNNATNTATGIQLFQDGIESWIMGMPANSAGLAWSASGSEQMRLTSTGLGIGTTSPATKLDVNGDFTQRNGSGTIIGTITNNAGWYDFGGSSNVNGAQMSHVNTLRFLTASTERMRLDSGGNLGVGTSAPWSQLTVGSGGSANPASTVTFHKSTVNEYRLKLTSSTFYSNGAWLGLGFGYSDSYMKAAIIAESKDGYARTNLHFALNDAATNANTSLSDSKMVLTYSGNLGLGVTPTAAWSSLWRVQQLPNGYIGSTESGAMAYGVNNYYDGSTYRYTANGFASQYQQSGSGTHFWRYAASGTAGDPVAFTIAMTLDNNGNLGVGTTSPGYKLDVAGAARSDSWIGRSNTSAPTADCAIFRPADNSIAFSTANAERARVDSAGNLGLGVTPSAWIGSWKAIDIVNGGTSLYGTLAIGGVGVNTYFDSGATWRYKSSYAAGRYEIDSLGSHSWFIAPSGTAGNAATFTRAMTLSPAGNLVLGTATDTGDRLALFTSPGSAQLRWSDGTNSTAWLDTTTAASRISTNTNLVFSIGASPAAATERARINSDGALLVATTGRAFNSNSVGAVINSSGQLLSGTPQSSGANMYLNIYSATGTAYAAYFLYNGNIVGTITMDGSNTSYNTGSDYRLKNITGPVTNSGAYIDSLNPVEGTWKKDGSTFVGLIAHEVQEVSRTQIATGEKDGAEMQAMDYSAAEIIANLIAEVKSLRRRLASAGL